MLIATWNVNSLKVRLPQVLAWLNANPVDVLCLQELKLVDEVFPHAELEAAGYHAVCAGQKTYNGVAIISRTEVKDVVRNLPNFDDPQQRVISATVNGVRVVCAYFPNGQEVGSDKYRYKLDWCDVMHGYLQNVLTHYPQTVLLGDFNIAPDDRDVHDPALWQGQILCSDAEREKFQTLLGLGFVDAFRLFDQPEKIFSWWDYRQLGFQKNRGLRIDLILLSQTLKEHCSACFIDKVPRKNAQPSDHAPVVARLLINA
jgi:exodeoxyribonuclease-3